MVPHCASTSANGAALRHFNRSSTLACFGRLARRRGASSARVLMVGMSNMLHTWHAMGADDAFTDVLAKKAAGTCGTISELASFRPHAVHYEPWLVVANTSRIRHKTEPVCRASGALGALGGGRLLHRLVERSAEAYDVVALYVGMWDVSYTDFDEASFADGLGRGVARVREAWPRARLVLFTLTPCGGELPNSPRARRYTPEAACRRVAAVNAAVRRVASAHRPFAQLLDAHQMVSSHPGAAVSGPPGIWMAQRNGWHFAGTFAPREREAARAQRPPHASGEMSRALANRLLDVVCPTTPAACELRGPGGGRGRGRATPIDARPPGDRLGHVPRAQSRPAL